MLSVHELIDILLMTGVTGFIFMDMFKSHFGMRGFEMRAFWMSCIVTGTSLVLHEMGHKFVAIASGIAATFHAHYGFLIIGVLLKILHFPLMFIVPGYVSMAEGGTPLVEAAIAFAGPGIHLVLWLTSRYLLRLHRIKDRTWLAILVGFREINMLLFILNMLPVPPLDGFHVARSLFAAFA